MRVNASFGSILFSVQLLVQYFFPFLFVLRRDGNWVFVFAPFPSLILGLGLGLGLLFIVTCFASVSQVLYYIGYRNSFLCSANICVSTRCVFFTVACMGAEFFLILGLDSQHYLPQRTNIGFKSSSGLLGVYKLFISR